jgi:hypothetical protein
MRVQEQEKVCEEIQRLQTERDDTGLEMAYSKLFKEKVAARNKQIQLLERQGIFNYAMGDTKDDIFAPAHLNPQRSF